MTAETFGRIVAASVPASMLRSIERLEVAAYCEHCGQRYTETEARRLSPIIAECPAAKVPGGHLVYVWCSSCNEALEHLVRS